MKPTGRGSSRGSPASCEMALSEKSLLQLVEFCGRESELNLLLEGPPLFVGVGSMKPTGRGSSRGSPASFEMALSAGRLLQLVEFRGRESELNLLLEGPSSFVGLSSLKPTGRGSSRGNSASSELYVLLEGPPFCEMAVGDVRSLVLTELLPSIVRVSCM